MARRRSDSVGDPKLHTGVIGDVASMWQKLVWDIAQFDDIQRSNPDLPEPLGFAAINVCITASSLRDWAVAEFINRARAGGRRVAEQEVVAHIHRHVPQQAMCEAIANTAKHARLRSGGWPDGAVQIQWVEADVDEPPGHVLRHIHGDGRYESIALNAFSAMQRSWWGELQNLGFAFSGSPAAFEWYERRIREMFEK